MGVVEWAATPRVDSFYPMAGGFAILTGKEGVQAEEEAGASLVPISPAMLNVTGQMWGFLWRRQRLLFSNLEVRHSAPRLRFLEARAGASGSRDVGRWCASQTMVRGGFGQRSDSGRVHDAGSEMVTRTSAPLTLPCRRRWGVVES